MAARILAAGLCYRLCGVIPVQLQLELVGPLAYVFGHSGLSRPEAVDPSPTEAALAALWADTEAPFLSPAGVT